MRKIAAFAFALTAPLALAAAPAFAAADDGMPRVGTVLGSDMASVKAALTEMGCEVRKAEMEDGKIEVYFVKDGKMAEVYVSAATGEVTKLKSK